MNPVVHNMNPMVHNLLQEKLSALSVFEGVVAQWCNHPALKPEQSGGLGSIPGKTPPLHRHDKGVADPIRSALFLRSQRLANRNFTSPSPFQFSFPSHASCSQCHICGIRYNVSIRQGGPADTSVLETGGEQYQ